MILESNSDSASIVILGTFNPKIFHPAWLALNGIISKEQANDADVKCVIPDLAQFTAGYVTYEVQRERYLVRCETTYKDLLKDVTLSAIGENLPHTPVWRLGINRAISFSCGSASARDKFGKLLAPRKAWGEWGKQIDRKVNNDHGGLHRMIMLEKTHFSGTKRGHVQADLKPVETDNSSIIIDINNDFIVCERTEATGTAELMECLQNRWEDAMQKAEFIVDNIMSTVKELQ